MKRMFVIAGLISGWFVGGSSAWAQVMQTQPVLVVLKSLKANGYIAMTKLQLVGNEYQILARDDGGEPVAIRMNSHNGQVIAMTKIDSRISMLEVVEKIEAVGYAGITFIEAKDNYYSVTALSPDGKTAKIKVDAFTGALAKDS